MSMHPIVDRFLQGGLPEPMAMALVGGSLPVPTGDLLQALAASDGAHGSLVRALSAAAGG